VVSLRGGKTQGPLVGGLDRVIEHIDDCGGDFTRSCYVMCQRHGVFCEPQDWPAVKWSSLCIFQVHDGFEGEGTCLVQD
jgi:hypothetical protein